MSHKLTPANLPEVKGTSYPAPHDTPCRERINQPLGLAAGLTQFGVNLTRLKPGVWTGQRHWHSSEDEFVWVLEGEVILETDEGCETFYAGDCAGFKAGVPNAHHFRNEGARDAVLLTVGTRSAEDACFYPDVDLEARPGRYTKGTAAFVHKNGSPFASPTDETSS